MSNEHQHPTFLVALRAEIGSIAIDLEKRLEHRVEQAEQAFCSLGWEMDTLRSNLKSADKDSALLQETNASLNARIGELETSLAHCRENNQAWKVRMDQAEIAYRELVNTDNAALAKHVEKIQGLEGVLHTMFTPAQVCERVNAVHDELVTKLSHERRELETVQKLLEQSRQERDHYAVELEKMRVERDEARLSNQKTMLENRGLRNLNQAQGGRIAELRAVGPALDILADMVKETQAKLEVAHQQKDELDADYGKLVGEYEDISKHFDLLRNLILDCKLDADDRYGSFGRAMRVDRKEAKMAIHTLVATISPMGRRLDKVIVGLLGVPMGCRAVPIFRRRNGNAHR
jgi:chromosome segregation ATPase